MTLEESINYYKEKAQNCNSRVNEFIYGVKRCKQEKEEYTQLINWLHELQERRKVDIKNKEEEVGVGVQREKWKKTKQ